MKTIEYLEWDSVNFNRKIGLLDYRERIINENNLETLLNLARKENYHLIYVMVDGHQLISNNLLSDNVFFDEKIIYYKKIDYSLISKLQFNNVEEYYDKSVDDNLRQLAHQSGKYSRFKRDENFGENDFIKLYSKWIENSAKHLNANKIFVIRADNNIIGMVTLVYKENVSEIGLIAVDPNFQRKGFGVELLNMCLKDSQSQDIKTIEVATQKINQAACQFYENNGFIIKSITKIYHYWL